MRVEVKVELREKYLNRVVYVDGSMREEQAYPRILASRQRDGGGNECREDNGN